jgi:hypothetical protein
MSDSSGNANDGTLQGDPIWQPSAGKFDGAILFDGDGDYVHIENESNFDIAGQITVSAWVNISSVPAEWAAIVTKGDSAWRLSTDAADRRFHFAINHNTWLNGQKVVSANEWHHIVGIYDGTQMRTFIDGAIDVSRLCQDSIGSNDYPVYIGENAEITGRCWDGLIDDVRIYSYALSEAEVADIYSGKAPPMITAKTGILAAGGEKTVANKYLIIALVIVIVASVTIGLAIRKEKRQLKPGG